MNARPKVSMLSEKQVRLVHEASLEILEKTVGTDHRYYVRALVTLGKAVGHGHNDHYELVLHGKGRLLYPDLNVIQYEPPMPGRAYNARPRAARAGPTVNGSLLPVRATRPPDHLDSANMITGNGRSAAPAAVAV